MASASGAAGTARRFTVDPVRRWKLSPDRGGPPGRGGYRGPMSTPPERVAVVTGGGSGIGAAVARALAADGWTVVIAGRRLEPLQAVAAGAAELPGTVDPVPADVTDETDVRRLFAAAVERHGRVDLLINNGSISAHTPRPHSIAYTATKHAITGLTKSTALDGRRYDIACGQIDIG